ncbi:hypothetical protein HK101_005548 [Irineochytrium annulatum]|nr:hypothetical protein HK101_005548 [Irineochytrium annulatum]
MSGKAPAVGGLAGLSNIFKDQAAVNDASSGMKKSSNKASDALLNVTGDEDGIHPSIMPTLGLSGNGKGPKRQKPESLEGMDEMDMEGMMEKIARSPEAAAALLQSYMLGGGAASPDPSSDGATASDPPLPPGMIRITPLPGMVIKTHLTTKVDSWPAGMKVFVNLCHSEKVQEPSPPDMDKKDMERAIKEGDSMAYRVPLSLAGPRTDRDKCE